MSKSITIDVPSGKTSIVALKSGSDGKIISYGTKVKSVVDEAKKKGVDDPIIMFVPKKGHRYIY